MNGTLSRIERRSASEETSAFDEGDRTRFEVLAAALANLYDEAIRPPVS
jgi:hypothetical protein